MYIFLVFLAFLLFCTGPIGIFIGILLFIIGCIITGSWWTLILIVLGIVVFLLIDKYNHS